MKKLLLSVLLIGLFTSVEAQTIDPAFKKCTAVKVATPFKVKWSDTTKAYYLCVAIMSDNLKDKATFSVTLYSAKEEALDAIFVEIKGADYAAWDGNNRQYPFGYVADKLSITIK